MSVKRLFIAISLIFVIVITAAVSLLLSTDYNQYKDLFADRVERITGRRFTIAGDVQLMLSLRPSLVVNNVSLGNASWASRPDLVKIDRMEAQVPLLPLLIGEVEVTRLSLIGTDILLESNTEGRGNWQLEALDSGGDNHEYVFPYLKSIKIKDMRIAWRDATTGQVKSLLLQSVETQSDNIESPMEFKASVILDQLAMELGGNTSALSEIRAGNPLSLQVAINTNGADIGISGEIKKPFIGKGYSLKVSSKGKDFKFLRLLSDIEIDDQGPWSLEFIFKDTENGYSIKPIELRIFGSDLQAGLQLQTEKEKFSFDFNLLSSNLDFDELMGMGTEGDRLIGIGSVVLDAQGDIVPGDDIRWNINGNANISIGETVSSMNDIEGEFSVSKQGVTPNIDAKLSSKRLNLNEFLVSDEASRRIGAKVSDDRKVFSNEPINTNWLKSINANLVYSADRFIVSNYDFSKLYAEATLLDGELQLNPVIADFSGSKVSADLAFDASKARPSVSLGLESKQINIGHLLEVSAGKKWLDGKGDIYIDLRGEGESIAEIMASLDGATKLLIGKGRASVESIDDWVGGISKAVGTMVSEDANYAGVNCVVSDFKVTKGIASSQVMLLDTEYSTVYGEGQIDLRKEELDLLISPKPKTTTLNVAVPVEVGGTLVNPTFTPEKLATGKKTVGALAAVGIIGFPPAALLTLGELGGDDNPCLDIAAGNHTKTDNTKSKTSEKEKESVVEKTLNDIGGAIKGLFGN